MGGRSNLALTRNSNGGGGRGHLSDHHAAVVFRAVHKAIRYKYVPSVYILAGGDFLSTLKPLDPALASGALG